MNNLLYIGLNGYAGSGKDTVAKMLYCILNYDWADKEECRNKFKTEYATNIRPYATMDVNSQDNMCTCIAFADRLKDICAAMFGVPVQYFYYNKNNSWICINKDFEYTETRPREELIVTAEDYYSCKDSYIHSSNHYYMSLREILVYVGTYVCQEHICEHIFVNSVQNKIDNLYTYPELKYVICTDVRFVHEYDFIKRKNGIMINIVRDGIEQADDIAEHDLDMMDKENYNYIVYNDGTYDELFDQVWEIVHTNDEFKNNIIPLHTRVTGTNTYLRILYENDVKCICKLCSANGIAKVTHSDGRIMSIDPEGGPQIFVPSLIYGTKYTVESIIFDDDKSEYLIHLTK